MCDLLFVFVVSLSNQQPVNDNFNSQVHRHSWILCHLRFVLFLCILLPGLLWAFSNILIISQVMFTTRWWWFGLMQGRVNNHDH